MGIIMFEESEKDNVSQEANKRQRIKERYALDDIGDTWLVNKLCNPSAVSYSPSNVIYRNGKMWRKRDGCYIAGPQPSS